MDDLIYIIIGLVAGWFIAHHEIVSNGGFEHNGTTYEIHVIEQ